MIIDNLVLLSLFSYSGFLLINFSCGWKCWSRTCTLRNKPIVLALHLGTLGTLETKEIIPTEVHFPIYTGFFADTIYN